MGSGSSSAGNPEQAAGHGRHRRAESTAGTWPPTEVAKPLAGKGLLSRRGRGGGGDGATGRVTRHNRQEIAPVPATRTSPTVDTPAGTRTRGVDKTAAWARALAAKVNTPAGAADTPTRTVDTPTGSAQAAASRVDTPTGAAKSPTRMVDTPAWWAGTRTPGRVDSPARTIGPGT